MTRYRAIKAVIRNLWLKLAYYPDLEIVRHGGKRELSIRRVPRRCFPHSRGSYWDRRWRPYADGEVFILPLSEAELRQLKQAVNWWLDVPSGKP